MIKMFSTSYLRALNFNKFSFLKRNNTTILNSMIKMEDTITIGFLNPKTLSNIKIDNIKKFHILSTITSLPSNIEQEQFDTFSSNLNNFGLKRIFIIHPSAQDNILGTSNNIVMNFTLSRFTKFFITFLKDNSFVNSSDWSNETIFIFHYPWYEVINAFKLNNIFIYGGSSTKRHILTPYQRRLSSICDWFQVSLDFTSKAYNSNSSLLSTNPKNLNSGSNSFNNKRNYSTFTSSSSSYAYNKFSVLYENSIACKKVLELFKSNFNITTKQLQLEELLRKFSRLEIEKILSSNSSNVSNPGLQLLIRQLKLLKNDFSKLYEDKRRIKDKPFLQDLKVLDPSLIISISFSLLIPFCIKFKDLNEQPTTDLFYKIGKKLYNEINYTNYLLAKEKNIIDDNIFLKDYSDALPSLDKNNEIKLGMHVIYFIFYQSNFIFIDEVYCDKNYNRTITPSEDMIKLIDNIIIIDSDELPMICPPSKWKIDSKGKIIHFGGFLSNNDLQFKPFFTPSYENESVKGFLCTQSLVDMVNKISSIPYCINTKVLDIIFSQEWFAWDSHSKCFSSEPLVRFKPHKETDKLSSYLNPKKGETKNFEKIHEIISHNSKYLYDHGILSIAKLMSNVDGFYFPSFLDWRGRLYISGGPLNFQGGELARSLLLFKEGEILNSDGLEALKIYGANAFGLDKKSKAFRLEWVENNLKEILNSPTSRLWLEADEPLIFLAFALELKGYYDNPSQFLSRLPILLDATCSGLQHLAAMAQDFTLADSVNLLQSNKTDSPNDLYSNLIEPIKSAIKELVANDFNYSNLSNLNITRKLIKRGIMTISYGVTPRGISSQLISDHFKQVGVKNGKYIYIPKDSALGNVELDRSDILKLSDIIHNSLFKVHPFLNNLIDYFNEMVKLLNKLDLPVTWITPSGLHITQKYIKFTSYDITNSILGRRKTVSLRKPVIENSGSIKINKVKQINSFVPNFIHSMDAANIALLFEKLSNYEGQNLKILTVHDCFGTSANDVNLMAYLVKESFIIIYGEDVFINQFHNFMLTYISNNFTLSPDKSYVISSSGKKLKIPQKPTVGHLDIRESLLNSLYFIN